jgi:hypothetical protein
MWSYGGAGAKEKNTTLFSRMVKLWLSVRLAMKISRCIATLKEKLTTWHDTLAILNRYGHPVVWLGIFCGASLLYLLRRRSRQKNMELESSWTLTCDDSIFEDPDGYLLVEDFF